MNDFGSHLAPLAPRRKESAVLDRYSALQARDRDAVRMLRVARGASVAMGIVNLFGAFAALQLSDALVATQRGAGHTQDYAEAYAIGVVGGISLRAVAFFVLAWWADRRPALATGIMLGVQTLDVLFYSPAWPVWQYLRVFPALLLFILGVVGGQLLYGEYLADQRRTNKRRSLPLPAADDDQSQPRFVEVVENFQPPAATSSNPYASPHADRAASIRALTAPPAYPTAFPPLQVIEPPLSGWPVNLAIIVALVVGILGVAGAAICLKDIDLFVTEARQQLVRDGLVPNSAQEQARVFSSLRAYIVGVMWAAIVSGLACVALALWATKRPVVATAALFWLNLVGLVVSVLVMPRQPLLIWVFSFAIMAVFFHGMRRARQMQPPRPAVHSTPLRRPSQTSPAWLDRIE